MGEFIPTLGNLISGLDAILRDEPHYLYNDYARLFRGTEIQKLLFSSKDFEEAASDYCRKEGWAEPE